MRPLKGLTVNADKYIHMQVCLCLFQAGNTANEPSCKRTCTKVLASRCLQLGAAKKRSRYSPPIKT